MANVKTVRLYRSTQLLIMSQSPPRDLRKRDQGNSTRGAWESHPQHQGSGCTLGSSSGLRCKLKRFFERRTLYFSRLAPLGGLSPGLQGERSVRKCQAQRAQLGHLQQKDHKNNPRALCPRMSLYLAGGKLGGPVGAGKK